LWGFIALDYFFAERETGQGEPRHDPVFYIDDVVSKMRLSDIVDVASFHKTFLCVSAQLLGRDSDEIVNRSVSLLRSPDLTIDTAQFNLIVNQYDDYGIRDLFLQQAQAYSITAEPAGVSGEECERSMQGKAPDGQVPVEKNVVLFYSYSHKDERMRNKLEGHLSLLKREGLISEWHDRKILPGKDLDESIDENLQKANVVLLLVSSEFIASDYCWGVEVKQAMTRADQKQAIVIPVILRPCEWHSAPFGRLEALPTDGRPVASNWKNQDEAFEDIAKGIRRLVKSL
jgi:hypothetical protein